MKKILDVDIRERIEAECRAIMADHPELEAVGIMFLSKHLTTTLAGLIVGADGPRLRPDQNVRMFESWVKIGTQLLLNNQQDVQLLDQKLAEYARRFVDAQTEAKGLQLQRTQRPTEDGS